MIGNNRIELNQSTMQEAVEYWLNTVMLKEPVKVLNIVRTGVNSCNTYSVKIEADGAEKEGKNVS